MRVLTTIGHLYYFTLNRDINDGDCQTHFGLPSPHSSQLHRVATMVALSYLLAVSVLHTASSTPVGSRTTHAPPTVQQDWQKNNVSAPWAPGHPIEWNNTLALKYTYSDGGPWSEQSGAIIASELSVDEKYLVSINASNHVSVVNFATGALVSDTTVYALGCPGYCGDAALRVLADSAGGYNVLVAYRDKYQVQKLHLTPNGTFVGNVTDYAGGLLWQYGSPSVSHSGRRFLTTYPERLYNIDKEDVYVDMADTLDQYNDVAFSPDDKLVAVAGNARIFDATTGRLVRELGETKSTLVSFSPDGSLLATTQGRTGIQIWSLPNATTINPPLNLTVEGHPGWTTSLAWSPDGAYLAAAAYGNVYIWEMGSSPRLIQHYRSDGEEVHRLVWLKGSKQLSYRTFGGLEVYDLETNLKYRWGFSRGAHWVYGQLTSTFISKTKGWIGGLDADGIVRYWNAPA